jgi:hypothetical protein
MFEQSDPIVCWDPIYQLYGVRGIRGRMLLRSLETSLTTIILPLPQTGRHMRVVRPHILTLVSVLVVLQLGPSATTCFGKSYPPLLSRCQRGILFII